MRDGVLVHAYSYEERSVKAVSTALDRGDIGEVLSIVYTDTPGHLQPAWRSNRQRIDTTISRSGVRHHVLETSTVGQITFERHLGSAVAGRRKVLDVSCMTHLHVLLTLRTASDEDLLQYVAASDHSVLPFERTSRHAGCLSVLGYEGHFSTGRPSLAVLIVGFEGQRSLSTYLELEPQRAVAVFGVPWIDPKDAAQYITVAVNGNDPLLAHHNVRSALAPSLSPQEFSLRLQKVIEGHVADIRQEWKEEPNVLIVPMGTKLQTVGLHAYWRQFPAARILYAARSKRERLSIGAGAVYVYAFSDLFRVADARGPAQIAG